MPGVVFLIVVPTANFERELIYGSTHEVLVAGGTAASGSANNLNINLPESNNAVLRLEVELRDKNAARNRRGGGAGGIVGGIINKAGPGAGRTGTAAVGGAGRGGVAFSPSRGGVGVSVRRAPLPPSAATRPGTAIEEATATTAVPLDVRSAVVPLEKVLEELLVKLEIEHVTWTTSKKGYFHQVVFPLQSGEPCETTLHCLTELGIGTKLNSSVSVLPCSVSYDALTDPAIKDGFGEDDPNNEDLSKWNTFVESIKSKLTVKQVVDGVRSGGALSFDYLLLVVTADSLAALGLIENNASNIVAAMLVSPLMGPVMSITFGTIISDRELMRVGFISLALGMFISCLFGFIFGLLLGTVEMPWGSGDWPTEEMRGRGNVRSLWMGVMWALTSGTGVAVALLQGSAGPLIGVAISASLLPPVVNCGLFWALACSWLMRPEMRMPHLQGEAYNETSAYPFLYTDYLPTEFFINGIVSGLLTVVNVICIFITAIIVLKIKEVSAPYTASPDLKRFWETDLRTVRKTNRSTMRHRKATFRDKLLPSYQGLDEPRSKELDTVLEQALKEAEDDVTFKKVKRMSYSSNAAGELTQRIAKMAGLNSRDGQDVGTASSGFGSRPGSRMNSIRNSKVNADLKALDKLVSSLLEQHTNADASSETGVSGARKPSLKLSRWRPTSRSAHNFSVTELSDVASNNMMPTIMESGVGVSAGASSRGSSSSLDRRATGAVRNVLQSMANAPQRLSQTLTGSGSANGNGNGGDNGSNGRAEDEENLMP